MAPPSITTPCEAEEYAANWLREVLGEKRVKVTAAAGDAGLDVISDRFSVQVKRYSKSTPVGRPDVQSLVGAIPSHLTPILLSSDRWTAAARTCANERGVALFRLPHAGNKWPTSADGHAARILANRPAKKILAPKRDDGDPYALAKVVRRRIAGAENLDLRVIAAIIREARRITG